MHDKERSRTIRSYLIRHQSSLLLQTMIQVNYLDLGRICSSARKWLFFSPVRGLPILDHVVLFCRLVLGAYGVSDAGRDHRVHAHLPPRIRARISLLHFHRILATDPSGKQLRTRPLPVNVFFFFFCPHYRHFTGRAGLTSLTGARARAIRSGVRPTARPDWMS